MPWKECHVMDERLQFVARLLEGEKMAPLCAAFGISRKTGYKIFNRYRDCGVQAFSDRSRRPYRQANRLPAPIEATIVRLKREYPGWGAPKIREKLRQQFTGPHLPAISTVHAVLDRHGLVHRRRRRRHTAAGTALSRPTEPNALWCADYKGEFMLANRRYCYPLTITDFASRYLMTCEALATTQEQFAFTVFERAFKDFGLPRAIRTDNGVPFASAQALYGLSKLAVWWLRLGIHLERIQPGHPEQNGRHERMHLTLKREATKPAAANVLQQQARFDAFIECYNHERPHQALGMQVPAAVYTRSPRVYRGLDELTYPFHDATITVTHCGRICFQGRKVNLSHVFAGQNVGVTQVGDHLWLVTFMQYDLGYFDDETCRLEPIENPFGPKVLPMSPA
ncbi:MAG TPA: IS481 family transposase [Gemmatimonadales bacterium]|nr:IS481 family transposase [Gemmatimonadales bacterium]